MSAVIIKIIKRKNGFSRLLVDGKFVGQLEDLEDEVTPVINDLIEALQIDNIEIIEETEK